jgi:hypothetical protein
MMAQWIEPGHAMQLTAHGLVLTIREWDEGGVTIDVAPEGEGLTVRQPAIQVAEGGRFVIGVEAVSAPVPEAVR